MEISDFIPSYPYVEDDDFNNKIYNLKEFHDMDSSINKDKWRHQDLLTRYAGANTIFNRHLIFHTPGTGKTCAAVKVIEDIIKLRPATRALIIVPRSLVTQWEKSIMHICADYVPSFYKLDEETLQNMTHEQLLETYSDILEKEVSTDQTKESLIKDILADIPNEHVKMLRIKKLMNKYYEITTKGTFGNRLKDKNVTEYLGHNSIIVIDEAHNLKDTEKEGKEDKKKNYYDVYYDFLHKTKGKILLLTGTPMHDDSGQIAELLNLLLDEKDKIVNFNKNYISNSKMIKEKADELEKKIRGMVSYITSEKENFPERVDQGELWNDVTQYIKVFKRKMSKLQQKGYEMAYNEDKNVKKDKEKSSSSSAIYQNSVAAINFVYKDKESYLWGEKASKLLCTTGYIIKEKYKKDIKDNIKKYSSKLKQIIKIAETKEQIFIFNEFVNGAHGCIFQANVLKLFGIKVGVIHGDTKEAERNNILNLFKRKGIQVLIGSGTIAEGISLTNVKHTISVAPWWNIARIDQALSRAIRADSEHRSINAYQLAADSDNLETNIDAIRFKTSERKDVAIKSVERFLKKVAWDCQLNYDRNYENGEDYSMQCDYEKCDWKCYGSPKFDNQIIDNWILFYSETVKKQLEDDIKKQFQQTSILNLNDIKTNSDNEINPTTNKLILLILEDYIKNNKKVLNKWGIECYIRYSDEVLYLSNNPSNEQISDVWYTNNCYINNYTQLSDVINDDIIRSDIKKIKKLDSETIGSLKPITQAKILEYAYYKKYNKILDIYKEQSKFFETDNKDVYKIDDMFKVYDSGWRDCDKKTECSEYNKYIKAKQIETTEVEKSEKKYDMYTIKKNNDLFLVTDPKSTGKKCANFKKYELIKQFKNKNGLLKEINDKAIELKLITKKAPEKQKMIDKLNKDLEKMEYDEKTDSSNLEYIYNIYNLTLSNICVILEHVFGLKK